MTRIAFLGTGIMGDPMARNLMKAGHDLSVWNRTKAKAEALVDAGAALAADPAEAAAGAEVLFTMLADDKAVGAVLEGTGAIEALAEDALVIDCSSISPPAARRHAEAVEKLGRHHLDAPVSGGPSGAEEASLAIMAGGRAEAFARARPYLEALGRPTHVGPAGAGQLAKLANQIIVGLAIGAVSEALLLAAQGGADPTAVRQAMSGGLADSKILQIHGERMLERRFLPGGPAAMHLKDMENVMAAAEASGLDLPLSREVLSLFRDLVGDFGGNVDHSALLLEIEKRNPGARLGAKDDQLPEAD